MTNKPDVSVVIPMHNASATVTEVVESFLAIEGSAVEVIVVDDASTDDSVERVTALGRPEVIVERFETTAVRGSPGTVASSGPAGGTRSSSTRTTRSTRWPSPRRSGRWTTPAPTSR